MGKNAPAWAAALLVAAAVGLATFGGLRAFSPPAPAPVDAPATEFSAGRALVHLRAIAREPHPTGTAEHAAVRDYIVGRLRAMGLEPSVQRATAAVPAFGAAGSVENVVARLPGTGGASAILLCSHYDSVATSPGAADDGSAVAAMLETLRALREEAREGSPLRNDVIFLFADGEEDGLLGAKAFVDDHPWARDVGLVLNLDCGGSVGPALIFETTYPNRWLIDGFAEAAPNPIASSWGLFAYKLMFGVGTNLDVFGPSGTPGLNLGTLSGSLVLHTPLDSVANLNAGFLQHSGDYALALTRHFGNLDLGAVEVGAKGPSTGGDPRPSGPNATFFNVLGLFVWYSTTWAVVWAAVAGLALVSLLVVGFRRRLLTPAGVGLGALALIVSLAATVVLVAGFWHLVKTAHPDFTVLLRGPGGDVYTGPVFFRAFAVLAVAVTAGAFAWFRRMAGVASLAAGALLSWLFFGVVLTSLLPAVSYLATWPLLAGVLSLGVVLSRQAGPRAKDPAELDPVDPAAPTLGGAVLLAVLAVPGVVLVVPAAYLLYLTLGAVAFGGSAFMVALLAGSLVPQLALLAPGRGKGSWLVPALAALIFAGLLLTGSAATRFDADHPRPGAVAYVLDADAGRAFWVDLLRQDDPWMERLATSEPVDGPSTDVFPGGGPGGSFREYAAPLAPLAGPVVTLLSDTRVDGGPSPGGAEGGGGAGTLRRILVLRVVSPEGARAVQVFVDPETAIVRAYANGKRVDTERMDEWRRRAGIWWGFTYSAPPEEGFELRLEVSSAGPVKILAVEEFPGLAAIPGVTLAQRPAGTMDTGDRTLVRRTFNFGEVSP